MKEFFETFRPQMILICIFIVILIASQIIFFKNESNTYIDAIFQHQWLWIIYFLIASGLVERISRKLGISQNDHNEKENEKSKRRFIDELNPESSQTPANKRLPADLPAEKGSALIVLPPQTPHQ